MADIGRSPKHEKIIVNSKPRKSAQRKPARGTAARSAAGARADTPTSAGSWTFLSNHTHVLVCLAADPDQTLRDVAAQVGITERAVQRIVSELETAGALTREREGRRNRYRLDRSLPLRHPLEQHRRIGDVLDLVLRAPA